jgi:DeoR/GlpR family transcriptional regulator of sugar metabolism
MIVHSRHQRILDLLQQQPSASVELLQQHLGVSRSTLRRDLLELEEQGEIVRVHGGVVHRDSLRGEPTYDRRRREAMPAKQSIAQAAALLIPRDCVVYLDAGTTCVEVARQLSARPDITIFTHSIRLLMELGDSAARLTCVGGEYRAVSQALVGGFALSWLKQIRVDFAILGASGLSSSGASTTELSEAGMKQEILQRARQNILVADARKWEKPAAVQFAEWAEINNLVTDTFPPERLGPPAFPSSLNLVLSGNEPAFTREKSAKTESTRHH